MLRHLLVVFLVLGLARAASAGATFAWSGDANWNVVDSSPPLNGWDDARGDGLPPQTGDIGNADTGTVRVVELVSFPGTLNINAGSQLYWNDPSNAIPTVTQLNFNGGRFDYMRVRLRSLNGSVAVNADTEMYIIGAYASSKLYLNALFTSSGATTITKTGEGGLMFRNTGSGANGFSSNFDVQAGVVSANGSTSPFSGTSSGYLGAGSVKLASGTTLQLWSYGNSNPDLVLDSDVSGAGTILAFRDGPWSDGFVECDISGASLSPGASTGVLTVKVDSRSGMDDPCKLRFLNDASLAIKIGGTTPGTEFDQLAINLENLATSNVNLNGQVSLDLSLLDPYRPLPTDTFTVINVLNSNVTLSGTFSNDVDGTIAFDDGSFDVSYTGGDGNDVVLSNFVAPPVAEPAGLALFGLALLGLRRRRS